jgi:hypothetical protein
MAHYIIDFTRLQRPEQAVVLMIAGWIQSGDQWIVLGPVADSLLKVLTTTHVPWTHLVDGQLSPTGAIDVTDAVVRVTEVERGLARYIYESPYGAIAIAHIALRYRVLIDGEIYGAYASPGAALVALSRPEAAGLPVGNHHTLADCGVPRDLKQWSVVRLPQQSVGLPITSTPAGDRLGLAHATRRAAAR